MTVIALGSVAGAPGVTRLAIGLAGAWPDERRRIVVEADPDGGRLGAELGVGVEPGLMALALAARAGRLSADEVVVGGAAAVGPWFLVPAPPSGEQAISALMHAGSALAVTMGEAVDDVWLVDTGRLSSRSPALPMARAADQVVLVSGGSFPALQLVAHRVEALAQAGCRVGVAVVEPTAWPTDEVAGFVGTDVLAVLPMVRHGRRSDIASMRDSAWRGWWRRVESLAAILAGLGTGSEVGATSTVGSTGPVGPGWPS